MKKVLSLVLVLAMVLSSMSFAFASPFTDIADTDYTKAIETLTALGVVTGYEDGTYRPEKVVTRAEMAKLIVEVLGYGDLVVGSKSNFSDTKGHWADAWIALAAGKGLVIGTGAGKFTPDRTVSYDEAITMVVRALGYTDASNELKNMTWPTNFKVKAAELKITKDVKLASTGADRGGVAQLLFNSLEAVLVTVNSDGDVVKTVDSDKDYILLLSRIATLDKDFDVTSEILDLNNKNYAGNLVELAPYMFQNIKVYLNDDDEVVYVKGSNSLVVEGTVDDVDGTVISIEDLNGKIKDIDLTSGTAIAASEIFENGSLRETAKLYADLLDTETIKVVADDLNGNGKMTANEIIGFVTTEQTKAGRIAKEYIADKTKLDGFVLPEDDDKADLANITVKGAVTSLEDIKIDDIVVQYLSEDETVTTLVVTRNAVEGKITRLDGTGKIYVDGKVYEYSSARGAVSGLTLGDEGVFFLDQDGYVVDYDGEAAGPTNYAVVIGTEPGSVTNKFTTKSIDDYPQIKLATQNDETVVYDIQAKIDSTTGNVTSSAKVGTSNIVDDVVVNAKLVLNVSGVSANDLVKYSLNSDGKISKIEIVRGNVAGYLTGVTSDNVDLDKSTNALASNAVIFDATDGDYDVINVDVLPTKFVAYVERNSNGEINVLVVKANEIDSAADTVYAYINKLNSTYNSVGDEVQLVVIYTDGQKKEIYTDALTTFSNGTKNAAFSFKYDGDVIDSSTVAAKTGSVATATAINGKGSMIKLDIAGSQNWYSLSGHATIVGIDPTVDSTPNSVNGIKDLYDISENDTIRVFLNADGDIDLIVIAE